MLTLYNAPVVPTWNISLIPCICFIDTLTTETTHKHTICSYIATIYIKKAQTCSQWYTERVNNLTINIKWKTLTLHLVPTTLWTLWNLWRNVICQEGHVWTRNTSLPSKYMTSMQSSSVVSYCFVSNPAILLNDRLLMCMCVSHGNSFSVLVWKYK